MIFNLFHYYSNALGIQTAVNVLLPDAALMERMGGKPVPTLYLLHGLSDDHNAWMRMTSLERYARKSYLAVVMPAVNRSFYTDMAYGAKYFTFVSRELPQVMEACFPLDKSREGRFVAGLSMGGYGALKLGLRLPERYQAVASFSGSLEIQEIYRRWGRKQPESLRELDAIFGGEKALRDGPENLRNLADTLQKTGIAPPKIYVSCGREDDLFPANESFVRDYGEALGIEYHRVEGNHTWDVWDKELERTLSWLPVERLEDIW
jgi:S-formylglutathione hydrolase FrmB